MSMLLQLYMESAFIKEDDEAEVKLTKKKIQELAKEWSYLEKQAAIMNALTEKISSRVKEIQSQLLPVVKKEEAKSIAVKSAMVEYTTRKSTSVKYQKAFERALEIVNEEQKQFLEEFKETVTSRGVIESVKLVDPTLAQFMNEVKTADAATLIELLPRAKGLNEYYDRSLSQIESEIKGLMKKAIGAPKEQMRDISVKLSQLQKEKRLALDREYEEKHLKESGLTDKVKAAVQSIVGFFREKIKGLTAKQKQTTLAVNQLEQAASAKD